MRPIYREKGDNIATLVDKGMSSQCMEDAMVLSQLKMNSARKKHSFNMELSKGDHSKIVKPWEAICYIKTTNCVDSTIEVARVVKSDMGVEIYENMMRSALREEGLAVHDKVPKLALSPRDAFFVQIFKDWIMSD